MSRETACLGDVHPGERDATDGTWVLFLFMYAQGGLKGQMESCIREFEANKAFKNWASGCTYLELCDDGRATEHICHHPARENPRDWIMCCRGACPYMVVNASPGELEECNRANAINAANIWCGGFKGKE